MVGKLDRKGEKIERMFSDENVFRLTSVISVFLLQVLWRSLAVALLFFVRPIIEENYFFSIYFSVQLTNLIAAINHPTSRFFFLFLAVILAI